MQDSWFSTNMPTIGEVCSLLSFSMLLQALKWLETPSAFYDGPIEGIYFRMDEDMVPNTAPRSPDDPPLVYNKHRGKIVRPDFLQGIVETWTKKQFKKNSIKWN